MGPRYLSRVGSRHLVANERMSQFFLVIWEDDLACELDHLPLDLERRLIDGTEIGLEFVLQVEISGRIGWSARF